MALAIAATFRKLLQRAEVATNAKLNQMLDITFALTGTVDTSGITDSAVTPTKASGGAWFWGTCAGTATNHVVTTTQPLTALSPGVVVVYEITGGGLNTGPVTVNVNGLGIQSVRQYNLQQMRAGDVGRFSIMTLRYSSLGYFIACAPGMTTGDRYAVSTGAANAYVWTTTGLWVPVAALYDGLRLTFMANFSNTGPATLNVDGVGVIAIRKADNQPLALNDILLNQVVQVVYDSTLACFLMVSPSSTATPAANAASKCFNQQNFI